MSTSADPSSAPTAEYVEICQPRFKSLEEYLQILALSRKKLASLVYEGPMTPTLLDVTMIIGLDITSSANPVSLNTTSTFEFKTQNIGGWSGFVAKNMGNGPPNLMFSFSGDPLGAQGDFEAISPPARLPPAEMSSSASPSIAPSAEYTEHLSNLVAIPSLSHENHYFLGPIGNLDPTEFIIAETNRIPFRLANPNQATKQVHRDELGISQALALTTANSAKDEPLMAAATYFWSNTINAFLFNQGPMTPTLLDITMITGLDVTSSANPMSLNTKNQFDFRTKSIGGWSGYVAAYMGKGSVTSREHVAFLLMWLEKFLFCGSSCGPTTNWQFLAEALETKRQFPLGKILLGYLYQMLNNASAKIAVGSIVSAGRPWWLLQTWLNLVAMKAVNQPAVTEAEFPRLEPITNDDGEERTHHRCMSDGEYASTPADAGAKLSAELLKDWVCSFYEGFQRDARVWFPYEDLINFDLPGDFRFEDLNSEKWWGEWKQNIFHQSTSMYMTDLFPDVISQKTESSPPRKSNSGRDIEYAPGLLPNGGGLAPPVIGYHAPKTSSLFQGQMREPADVGRKRKTKASAIDPLALAPKKKTKKNKPTPADDLPALDPSIEQALDEEKIEEDIDQAAAEKKKTVVRKKSAVTTLKPAPPPPPPPSPPMQQMSSDRTPLATGSHHVEEEEQPAANAIPVLADLFSFDIKDYFDEEVEEESTSKALAPLDETVKKTLEDISIRLESSLDNLVADCGSIRARFAEIQALVPDDLANTITLAVYLEQHQFKLEKAKQWIADRRERKDIEATIQANWELVHEEKAKLDQLSAGPIQSNIDKLEARKIDLIAQLEECNAELNLERQKLANLPSAVEEHKSRLRSAIKNVADMTKSLKFISGTDTQDIQAIEEVDQIRQRAVSAIQRYLSR
uniref:OSJNBa0039G19.1 protein n=1 Tax=Oryza sativa subsp. japonica TaxID=39947 RepID=Q7XRY7_ORYSJ|nr:OSJNBa0039G19.1 [Oryza sativa Japonica Group]CAE02231.2 OSJNBb0015C06.9 [Oryza sativa Japonica Group]